MSDFHGGDIEFLGRAMTRQEREKRLGLTTVGKDFAFLAENPNYIPIEELVSQELLKETPDYDWDDDDFDYDPDEDDD